MTDGVGTMIIRPVEDSDRPEWAELFRAYREFYRLEPSEAVVGRVWSWLRDEAVPLRALVADRNGQLLGLAHHRTFHRPSSGTIGTYLDDLFVRPEVRGFGVGRALLRRLAELAGHQDHSVVRWITARDNQTARRLYDTVAEATPWVTYDLAPVVSD